MSAGPGDGPLSEVRFEPYVSAFSSKSHQKHSTSARICQNLQEFVRTCENLQESARIATNIYLLNGNATLKRRLVKDAQPRNFRDPRHTRSPTRRTLHAQRPGTLAPAPSKSNVMNLERSMVSPDICAERVSNEGGNQIWAGPGELTLGQTQIPHNFENCQLSRLGAIAPNPLGDPLRQRWHGPGKKTVGLEQSWLLRIVQ